MTGNVILKDDKIIKVPKGYLITDEVFLLECTPDNSDYILAYWEWAIHYDPEKIKKEEEEFLDRLTKFRKRKKYECNKQLNSNTE